MDLFPKVIGEFGFIHIQIPAEKEHDIGVIPVFLVNDRLTGPRGGNSQKAAELFDGVDIRCFYRCERFGNSIRAVLRDAFRRLHISPVAAGRTEDDGILTGGCEKHEFMGKAASHHAGIRGYGQNLRNACPGKNPFIGTMAAKIISFQIFRGSMEGISILHGKFAHPDKAGARAGFIPEFGLDLVNHKGITAVGGAIIPDKLHGRFLVRHPQHQRGTIAILQAQQLAAHGFVPSRFLPEGGREDYRELYLLPVQGIHFFPDNLLDLFGNPPKRGQGRINSVCHILHIAAPQHERVAFDDTVGGSLFKALPDQVGKFHDK